MEGLLFHDPALNAVVVLLCFMVLPFPLLFYAVVKMKFASKRNLLQYGSAFILLSLLFAPLFTGLLGIISGYENQLLECQTNYLYQLQFGHSSVPCTEMSTENKEDLNGFKNLAIILSVFVTVVILSLGVNLIASAIAMTHDNLLLKELSEQVSEISQAINAQTSTLNWLFGATVILLVLGIMGFLYVAG